MKTAPAYLLVVALFGLIAFSSGYGCGGGGSDGSSGTTGTTGTVGTNGTNGTNGTGGSTSGVSGHVRSITGPDVGGVTVRFFDASGAELTPVSTDSQGRFTAALPTTARTFSVSADFGTYYVSFGYNRREYSPSIAGCHAPLPTITEGSFAPLVTDIVLTPRTETPPPAPDGCL